MSMTTKIAAVGLSAALGAGVFAAVPALAQDDPPEQTAPAGEERDERTAKRAARQQALAAELGVDVDTLVDAVRNARQQVHDELDPPETAEEAGARRAAVQDAVAAELGISVDELRSAERAVLADRLAHGVENGRITQEKADEILAAFDDGTLPELRRERFGERLPDRLADAVQDGRMTQEEADEIQAAFDDGTLRQLIREKREAGQLGEKFGQRLRDRFGGSQGD
jgi:hypothetical protein